MHILHEKMEGMMTAFDEELPEGMDSRRPPRSYTRWFPVGLGRSRVDQVLSGVRVLTFFQSKNAMWFLLRAFRFECRIGHGLLSAEACNYIFHMKGLSESLRWAVLIQKGSDLPDHITPVQRHIYGKWGALLSFFDLQLADAPGRSRSSRSTMARKITGLTSTMVNSCTK